MLFNSIDFLLFFPIITLIYFILPKKVRYIWLLVCSYYFYMSWEAKYALLLFLITMLTYVSGIILEAIQKGNNSEEETQKYGKAVMCITIILNVSILCYYKYLNYILDIFNKILGAMQIGRSISLLDIILPVGISFYIFQAMGYVIDVYRGDIYAEKNFLKYALFVSFFPQLVAGPIERSKNLLVQIGTPKSFSCENLRKGTLLMLWGFFLKLVIADRAAIIVNTVYADSITYAGLYIVIATFFFAIQIYCDFAGYSTIARGAALVLGYSLTDNFKAPYFAKSVREFWRRWHVSLTGWFRDYLYIPLGGNRKGAIRKEVNLLFVFLVSGLWHGSASSYIVWGLLNGIYQVIGDIFHPFYEKAESLRHEILGQKGENGNKNRFSKDLLERIITFLLISFTWLFFRAGGMASAFILIKNMMHFNWIILLDHSLYSLGVPEDYFKVLIGTIILLFIVDYKKYKEIDMAEWFLAQSWWFRTAAELFLIFIILLYGCYGEIYDTTQFIYFQF